MCTQHTVTQRGLWPLQACIRCRWGSTCSRIMSLIQGKWSNPLLLSDQSFTCHSNKPVFMYVFKETYVNLTEVTTCKLSFAESELEIKMLSGEEKYENG